MEDRMRREVSEFVAALAKSQQEKLAAAGTFVEIEELTAEIGDEVSRQLANLELSRRSEALCEQPTHACPDCGKECSIEPDSARTSLPPSIIVVFRRNLWVENDIRVTSGPLLRLDRGAYQLLYCTHMLM